MSANAMISEFPFVQELPKREKGLLRSAWDAMQEFKAKQDEVGPLIPFGIAAKLLNVSHQRISQLVDAGVVEGHTLEGHRFVSFVAIVNRARAERSKGGRPKKKD